MYINLYKTQEKKKKKLSSTKFGRLDIVKRINFIEKLLNFISLRERPRGWMVFHIYPTFIAIFDRFCMTDIC